MKRLDNKSSLFLYFYEMENQYIKSGKVSIHISEFNKPKSVFIETYKGKIEDDINQLYEKYSSITDQNHTNGQDKPVIGERKKVKRKRFDEGIVPESGVS